MKKTIKVLLASLLMVTVLLAGSTSVFATAVSEAEKGATSAQGAGGSGLCLFTNSECETGVFNTIANAGLFIIGALSVIMLIYGGIRYTISGGDQSQVTNAKNTILYAIVGIVVALLAGAIVNWVLATLGGGTA